MPTPNEALANYSTYASSCSCDGTSATLQAAIVLSKETDWNADELTLFTVPEEARPSADRNLYRMALCVSSSGAVRVRGARVEASGRVRFLNIGGSTPDVSVCLIPGVTYLL